jgi:hypothetical protein
MQQWSNSDAWDLSSFMYFFSIWDVIDHIFSFCNALKVLQQWWNSDAFDLSSFMSFPSFWDVSDHILSFCNALGVC